MHDENIRLLNDIHMFDVLRCDRGIAENEIEGRCAFSHYKFIETYLSIDPELRMPRYGSEKWLLRKAFDGINLLPHSVLWRPKEAFSDAISSIERSWYTVIQEHINDIISDKEFDMGRDKYSHMTPMNKEALYFRRVFERFFGVHQTTASIIPYFWLPRWCGNVQNPSARVLSVYQEKHK
jgi:asparagine synthase (glutamine-hydrolysing)